MIFLREPLKFRKGYPFILLAVLTISYFSEVLFGRVALTCWDLGRYFYPLRFFTVNSIKSGILPLWDPYISSGVPHLALQQSVIFYPLSIIYYILPFGLAFNIFIVLHIFLAGFFTYLLCRHWSFSHYSATISAITFMFSGYLISVIPFSTTVSSLTWLPLILLFFDRALNRRSAGDIFWSAIFLCIMFLGGEPSVFYVTLIVLSLYFLFFWIFNDKGRNFKKDLIILLVVLIVAVLLSAFQMLPFIELVKLSDRANIPIKAANMWSMSLRDTLSFIIPFLGRYDFSREAVYREQSWATLIYIGTLSLILIPLCMAFAKAWRVKFIYFITLLFLILSYGFNTPLYHLFYKLLPGFNLIRYPVRFLHIFTFGIAIICGAGFDLYLKAIKEDPPKLKRFFRYILAVSFIFSIIILLINLNGNMLVNKGYKFFTRHADPKNLMSIFISYEVAIKNIERCLMFFIAGAVVLFFGFKRKLCTGVTVFSFISILILDLFSTLNQDMMSKTNLGMFHSITINTAFLKNDKSVFRFIVSPKTREMFLFLKGDTYEGFLYKMKNAFMPNIPVIYGMYDANGYDSLWVRSYGEFMRLVDTSNSPSDTKLLNLLNVKYIISQDEIKDTGYSLVNKCNVYLYKNKNVMPRVFLAPSYNVLKKDTDIINKLKSKEFDPAKEVIIEEEPVIKLPPRLAVGMAGQRQSREKAEIAKYSPNEVIIKAVLNSSKFLVLSDTYYPGWKVYVDGKREKLYKADLTFRAAHIGEGAHEVRFIFDPFTFKLGAVVSLVTIIIMAAIVMRRYI